MQTNGIFSGAINGTGTLALAGNTIRTRRYDITVTKGEVKIFDRQSNTWVKAWGDPHLTTGDGDKAQFHRDNLTIDLQDGTKVTMIPTAPNAQGIAEVGGLQVLNGDLVTEVSNINVAPRFQTVRGDAAAADARVADGTVLRAGRQVDDLFFTGGQELVGGDPTQRWGEWMLDGRGGTSQVRPGKGFATDDLLGPYKGMLDNVGGMFSQIRDLMGQITPGMKAEDITKITTQVQILNNTLQQLMTALTNIIKTEHDTKMAVARNTRGS